MSRIAFLDTETTGLDPDRHEVWEVGLILRGEDGDREFLWQLPVDLGQADAMALNIGRWYERRWPWPAYYSHRPVVLDKATADENEQRETAAMLGEGPYVVPRHLMADWAALFAELTNGAHLVGAVISFDEERLRRLLRKHGACPTWHYHLVDVEALAAGKTGAEPPWNSNDLSCAVGVDPDDFDRHTALGDARWARAIYDVVIGGAS